MNGDDSQPSPMSAIEAVRVKLQSHPQLQYEHTASSITVAPETADGFPVSLFANGTSFVVGFGGWHEHFDSESEAINCFAFGLSDQCRLRVTSRGDTDYRWTVQHVVYGNWCDDSETGLLFFPFWRRRRERFHQNRIIRNG
jgi:hypothetical protein